MKFLGLGGDPPRHTGERKKGPEMSSFLSFFSDETRLALDLTGKRNGNCKKPIDTKKTLQMCIICCLPDTWLAFRARDARSSCLVRYEEQSIDIKEISLSLFACSRGID